MKIAIAVASLSRLSPSTRRVRRAGAPRSRKIAITAAGSVVAMIAASSRQATSGTPASGQSARPTAAVVASTAITARTRTGAASSTRRRTSMVRAASNKRIGRKTNRNPLEVIGKSWISLAISSKGPVIEVRRRKPAPMPTTTPTTASSTLCGRLSRVASGCSSPIRTSRPATTNRTCGRLTKRAPSLCRWRRNASRGRPARDIKTVVRHRHGWRCIDLGISEWTSSDPRLSGAQTGGSSLAL